MRLINNRMTQEFYSIDVIQRHLIRNIIEKLSECVFLKIPGSVYRWCSIRMCTLVARLDPYDFKGWSRVGDITGQKLTVKSLTLPFSFHYESSVHPTLDPVRPDPPYYLMTDFLILWDQDSILGLTGLN